MCTLSGHTAPPNVTSAQDYNKKMQEYSSQLTPLIHQLNQALESGDSAKMNSLQSQVDTLKDQVNKTVGYTNFYIAMQKKHGPCGAAMAKANKVDKAMKLDDGETFIEVMGLFDSPKACCDAINKPAKKTCSDISKEIGQQKGSYMDLRKKMSNQLFNCKL